MIEQRRGRNVALLGALLQAAFTVVMLVVAVWTHSPAAMACTWLLAGGVALWLMTAVLMYCQQLQQREAAELEQLAQAEDGATTIFEGEGADAHRAAEARVAMVRRWVVPIFTLLWAGYNGAIGYLMLGRITALETVETANGGQAALFALVAVFVAFLFSFYALGMSRQTVWRPLRAPANYLLAGVLSLVAILIVLITSLQDYAGMDRAVAYAIPVLQLVLAAELLLSLVMELYRPRVATTEQRLVYDSRLFGLIGQWRRIGQAVAEAVNYQFGYEVSTTWFFRLLAKTIGPLLLGGAVVMLLISSIVLVDQGEVAVVSHLGKIDTTREPLGPGIHLKWPWPVDTTRHFDLRVRSMLIGTGQERERRMDLVEGGTFDGREMALWTEEHGAFEENNFLVAVARDRGRDAADSKTEIPPVNVIRLTGVIHYRVSKPYRFGYAYRDAERVLSDIAHREMVRYCSSATLLEASGQAEETDRPEAIMTYGRERMANELQRRIEEAVAHPDVDLGIEIVSLNVRTVHPPTDAADAYEEVLKARLGREVQRYQAQAEANRLYFSLAAEAGDAQKLAMALERARALETLEQLHSSGVALDDPIGQLLQRVETHMGDLDMEIHRETLLGQLGDDDESVAAELRGALEEYAAQLEQFRGASQAGEPLELRQAVVDARAEADKLFVKLIGKPATLEAEAWADRWEFELDERARWALYPAQLEAFQAAPDVYMLDRYLDVWDDVLPNKMKYIIGFDPNRLEPWLNLEQGGSFQDRIQFTPAAP